MQCLRQSVRAFLVRFAVPGMTARIGRHELPPEPGVSSLLNRVGQRALDERLTLAGLALSSCPR